MLEVIATNIQDVIDANQYGADRIEPVSYTHLTLPTTPYV